MLRISVEQHVTSVALPVDIVRGKPPRLDHLGAPEPAPARLAAWQTTIIGKRFRQAIFTATAVSLTRNSLARSRTADNVGRPSVGNWNLRCRSHYVVRDGRVIEAPQWTKDEIEAGRKSDKQARMKYFAGSTGVVVASEPDQTPVGSSWIGRLTARFKSRVQPRLKFGTRCSDRAVPDREIP